MGMRGLLPLNVACALICCIAGTCSGIFASYRNEVPQRNAYGAVTSVLQPNQGKTVHFIFTADSLFEGGKFALDLLENRNLKASFFFTGNFLRDSNNRELIERTVAAGHYVGPHGDRHILLADWDVSRTTLVSADSALKDMTDNVKLLADFGVDTSKITYIVPSFEWCNKEHVEAFEAAGYLTMVQTPGLITYLDYTTPDMPVYATSDSIWNNFIDNLHTRDLDGWMILVHLGTECARHDKFYRYLPAMIDSLTAKGYKITPVNQ